MRFLVVVEETQDGYSAYSPGLAGCIATGSTRDEVERDMAAAIAFHLEGLQAEGHVDAIPSTPPKSQQH